MIKIPLVGNGRKCMWLKRRHVAFTVCRRYLPPPFKQALPFHSRRESHNTLAVANARKNPQELSKTAKNYTFRTLFGNIFPKMPIFTRFFQNIGQTSKFTTDETHFPQPHHRYPAAFSRDPERADTRFHLQQYSPKRGSHR